MRAAGGERPMILSLDFYECVLRVFWRPSRAPTEAEVLELPAKERSIN